MPRTMKMAQEIFQGKKIIFLPIIAEAIVKKFSVRPFNQEFLEVVSQEVKGICDWENEEYNKQKKEYYIGKIHPEDENKMNI